MKAVEFEGTVTPSGQITVPAEIAEKLPLGEPLRVVLQWSGSADDDGAWRAQVRNRFEAAYAREDAVYEQLMVAR